MVSPSTTMLSTPEDECLTWINFSRNVNKKLGEKNILSPRVHLMPSPQDEEIPTRSCHCPIWVEVVCQPSSRELPKTASPPSNGGTFPATIRLPR